MNSCINESNATFHAILSAYLSIIAGIIEAVLAVLSGREEISMSLYGIALVAVVDVTGSLLVLKMWQCRSSSGERLLPERLMEMNYSIVIGVLMTVLGTFLIADSIHSLVERETPTEGDVWGLVVTIFGCCGGLFLGYYKHIVGAILDSSVISADAISSFCSGVTSAAALLVIFINSEFWWADSAAGFATALYTLYSGVSTIVSARAKRKELKSNWNHVDQLEIEKYKLYHGGYSPNTTHRKLSSGSGLGVGSTSASTSTTSIVSGFSAISYQHSGGSNSSNIAYQRDGKLYTEETQRLVGSYQVDDDNNDVEGF